MGRRRGKFIVIEGLDGSGKSTQAKRVVDYLDEPHRRLAFGYRGVHLTREPTDGLIGGLIRSQLKGDWRSSGVLLQLLFAADRAYHLEKEVLPFLEKGVIVVSDRYFFSSVAYGSSTEVDMQWLLEINKKFLAPDITFFIDTSPRTCLERMRTSRFVRTLFEREKELTRIRANYKRLFKKRTRVVVVDGEKSAEEVTDDILKELLRRQVALFSSA